MATTSGGLAESEDGQVLPALQVSDLEFEAIEIRKSPSYLRVRLKRSMTAMEPVLSREGAATTAFFASFGQLLGNGNLPGSSISGMTCSRGGGKTTHRNLWLISKLREGRAIRKSLDRKYSVNPPQISLDTHPPD
jgi:hypothetical protein